MKRSKNLFAFFAVIIWCNICMGQQDLEQVTVRSFLKDILVNESYDPQVISKKYIEFQPLDKNINTGKVNGQREQMVKNHLEEINKKYRTLYDPKRTKILPFNKLDSAQQIPFDSTIVDHVYAVIFNTNTLMYLWVEGQKIKAFDLYMQKGSGNNASAYFLTY
ncbi:MAG TPA: hypothetical protein VN040_20655 [Pseudosphingobacterium sp.]|nr:hypothetical protein [Pseudosphingobacterium sp.]